MPFQAEATYWNSPHNDDESMTEVTTRRVRVSKNIRNSKVYGLYRMTRQHWTSFDDSGVSFGWINEGVING